MRFVRWIIAIASCLSGEQKYELTEHPAIRYTVDGGGAPYIHHGHNTTPAIPGTPFFQVISADETNKEKETAA